MRALEQVERLRLRVDRARLDACRHIAQPLEAKTTTSGGRS